jgi:hypothetical protein
LDHLDIFERQKLPFGPCVAHSAHFYHFGQLWNSLR